MLLFPVILHSIALLIDRLATAEASVSDRSGQKRKSEDDCKPTEFAAFSASPSLGAQVSAKPIFAFGGSGSPGLSNGSTHASPPTFSFSAVPAITPATQPAVASSTGASSITTFANVSSPASEIPKLSFVQFGASNAASSQTLASPLPGDSSAKAADTNTVKPFAFGGSPNLSTAGATTAAVQNTADPSGITLTTPTAAAGLFSSNAAGQSTSATTNTPTFTFGNSEKTTTPSAPTFAFGSSATTASATTSSPSVAPTPGMTAPVSTSTTTTTTTSTTKTAPSVTFVSSGSTGAFTFGASSQPADSSSQTAPFAFGAAATSSNSGTSIFGFGASTSQNISSNTSMPSSGSSQSSFGLGAPTGSVFGTRPAQPESTGTQLNLQPQNLSNQSSSPFSSAASSPATFGASSGFSFSSTVSPLSSTSASTTQSSLFGSGSSNSPSMFGTTTFGSNPSTSTFTFGLSSSAPSTSFTFGAQSSTPAFSFTANSNNSTALGFGLSNPNTSSSTAFGSVSPGGNNDQMSMEDSMVDDTNQVATPNPPVPVFGQTGSLFGAPSGAPAPGFQFGAQPSQSLFQPGSNLEFNAGNQAVSGSGAGGDKANRRIVKVSRNKPRRK